MKDTFSYIDRDGSTMVLREVVEDGDGPYINITESGNLGASSYVPPAQAYDLAKALIATIDDYDHRKTFEDNYTDPLTKARHAIMHEVGLDPIAYSTLHRSIIKLIDALVEARKTNG